MPSWFSKVFKADEDKESNASVPASVAEEVIEEEEEVPLPEPRRVVNAPVLADGTGTSGYSDEIVIKAKVGPQPNECIFMVDRPLLKGLSFWAPNADAAYASAPLAATIFDSGGVLSVLIHEMTLTVTRDSMEMRSWEEMAKAIGAQIRAHLKSGMPILDPDYQERIADEATISKDLQRVIDEEINPGIASHSGVITLNRVVGNTVYITMGGGCHGCAASSITLRSGIEGAFRASVPELGAVLDETDHTSGTNPFFKELPAEMGM
ncbi:MAG: NifU family protein [Candidatus Hydrogenedentes bacterium]|nr:NifU family protein [Candidatus Hydrogenedentota bacterium]